MTLYCARLSQFFPRVVAIDTCVGCGNVSSAAAWTPPDDAQRLPGGHLCPDCAAAGERPAYPSRSAYDSARADRLALIQRSAELGYPCRQSEVL